MASAALRGYQTSGVASKTDLLTSAVPDFSPAANGPG